MFLQTSPIYRVESSRYFDTKSGVYIFENTPPSWEGGGTTADVKWGKNMKSEREKEKGGNVKEKGRKGRKKE
jgi:hypothetical protein